MHSPRTLSFCLFSVFWGGTFRFTSPYFVALHLFVQSYVLSLECVMLALTLHCSQRLWLLGMERIEIVDWAWFLGFPHHLIKIYPQLWQSKLTSTFILKYTPYSVTTHRNDAYEYLNIVHGSNVTFHYTMLFITFSAPWWYNESCRAFSCKVRWGLESHQALIFVYTLLYHFITGQLYHWAEAPVSVTDQKVSK